MTCTTISTLVLVLAGWAITMMALCCGTAFYLYLMNRHK